MSTVKTLAACVTLLSVAALAACEAEPGPPFEIEGTGTLEGRVFLDAARDELYDPFADDALEGVTVRVFERGTSRLLAGAQATTDEHGFFRITGLPPGTHDVLVDTATVAGRAAFCVNPVQVSIYRHEPTFRNVTGREGCVIPILEAKSRPVGEVVTVRGVVTVQPGQHRTQADNGYIQDNSSGIQLFNFTGNLAVGDSVEVQGTRAVFNNELQLTQARVLVHVPGPFDVDTFPRTAAQALAAGLDQLNPDAGRLLVIRGAQIVSTFGTGRNAAIDDGSLEPGQRMEVRIEPGVNAQQGDALTTMFPQGNCYDITGVLGLFLSQPQIKPRSLADVVQVPCQ
jgi:hypothetical protein